MTEWQPIETAPKAILLAAQGKTEGDEDE